MPRAVLFDMDGTLTEPLLDFARINSEMGIGDRPMVGDGVHDVQAGLAAGSKTVWNSHWRDKSFVESPWRTVRDLIELLAMMQSCAKGQSKCFD